MKAGPLKFVAGDRVRILSIPNWLIHDLPEEEQKGILACIGSVMVIEEIDEYGVIWIGFGETIEHEDHREYLGQSFIVEPACIERVG